MWLTHFVLLGMISGASGFVTDRGFVTGSDSAAAAVTGADAVVSALAGSDSAVSAVEGSET